MNVPIYTVIILSLLIVIGTFGPVRALGQWLGFETLGNRRATPWGCLDEFLMSLEIQPGGVSNYTFLR